MNELIYGFSDNIVEKWRENGTHMASIFFSTFYVAAPIVFNLCVLQFVVVQNV